MPGLNLIYYNIFICLSIGIIGLLNLLQIYKKYYDNREAVLYALAWFFGGMLWLTVGIGAVLNWLGLDLWELRLYYLAQLFVALNISFIFFFLFDRIFRNDKIGKFLFMAYAGASFAYFLFILIYGFDGPYQTNFASEYVPNIVSASIFKVVFGSGIIFLIYAFLYEPFRWYKYKKVIKPYRFFSMLALVIYAMAGYFEELGLYENWHLFLIRLLLLTSMLIAYLSYNYSKVKIVKPKREAH